MEFSTFNFSEERYINQILQREQKLFYISKECREEASEEDEFYLLIADVKFENIWELTRLIIL